MKFTRVHSRSSRSHLIPAQVTFLSIQVFQHGIDLCNSPRDAILLPVKYLDRKWKLQGLFHLALPAIMFLLHGPSPMWGFCHQYLFQLHPQELGNNTEWDHESADSSASWAWAKTPICCLTTLSPHFDGLQWYLDPQKLVLTQSQYLVVLERCGYFQFLPQGCRTSPSVKGLWIHADRSMNLERPRLSTVVAQVRILTTRASFCFFFPLWHRSLTSLSF